MAAPRPVRGATLNRESARFNIPSTEADGDWLDAREIIDGAPPRVQTTVTIEKPRTIISSNQSPDVPFNRSINPYRGCEHGCIYCFARPSHAYHDLSPGLDFESKLFAKPDAAVLLRAELSKPSYVCEPIAMGTNTDPYQPIERDWQITRQLLEVLSECDHPVVFTTKSDRIVRDIDLIAPMAAKRLAAVAISITSLDPRIAMTIEPRAPHPERRLTAVRRLTDAGIPTYVNMAPLIPVMHIIQSIRGGKDNDPGFFTRMRGSGPWAELIKTRFAIARRKHGIEDTRRKIDVRTDLFRRPRGPQGELF